MNRHRSWRGLVGVLAAEGAAWTGTRLSNIALPWFVLTTTGSASQTGFVVFAEMAPYVISQLLSGPFIDRVGPRRISIIGDIASMGVVALVPLLYAFDALSYGLLLALVAMVGACRGPADASKSVFIPDVTAAAGVPLERGTGLAGTIERLSSTVGPALAGVLVAALGGAYALVITSALFGLGGLIIASSVPAREPAPARGAEQSYLTQLRAGARFLRGERLLRSIVGMVAVTNLLDAAYMSVLIPVWARDTGHGPEAIGLILGIMSGFSAAASLIAAAIAHRLPRRVVYVVSFIIGSVPRYAVLAFDAPVWVIIAVFATSGFASGFINPIIGAIQYERIPRELLGRVRTLGIAVAWSGIPFGGIVGGALVTLAGLSPALLTFGAIYLVTTTLPAFQKEWAEMNHDRKPAHLSG